MRGWLVTISQVISRASPTLRRRQLAETLLKLRQDASLSARDAAASLGCSEGKIRYLEAPRSRRPAQRDVADLLDLYASHGAFISEGRRDEILQMAREARMRGWWQSYADVLTEEYRTFIGLEAAAEEILAAHPLTIPGLLQTPAYMEAVVTAAASAAGRVITPAELRRRTEVRERRQDVLTRAKCPARFHTVIDEAVLHRRIGDGLGQFLVARRPPVIVVGPVASDGRQPSSERRRVPQRAQSADGRQEHVLRQIIRLVGGNAGQQNPMHHPCIPLVEQAEGGAVAVASGIDELCVLERLGHRIDNDN